MPQLTQKAVIPPHCHVRETNVLYHGHLTPSQTSVAPSQQQKRSFSKQAWSPSWMARLWSHPQVSHQISWIHQLNESLV
jgi:hypothetical protein